MRLPLSEILNRRKMAKLGQIESEMPFRLLQDSGEDLNEAWYALRVRSRSELLVAGVLTTRGLKCFAPALGNFRSYGGRVKHVIEAAFPGYLFCRFDLAERLRVLNAPGVQYIVGTARFPERIEESVIRSLQSAFASDKAVTPTEYLRGGDPVRVVRGPLLGATGVMVRLKGKDQLVISVDLLQRSVSVEIEADAVVGIRSRSVAATSTARSNQEAQGAPSARPSR